MTEMFLLGFGLGWMVCFYMSLFMGKKNENEDNAPVIGRGQFEIPTRTRPRKESRNG